MISHAHQKFPLWLAFAVPLSVLLLHSFYYYPFFVDDAWISLRYSERLVEGHGLTWNDGEHVEGYSNLLLVLLTALLGAIGFDYVAAARVIGLLASIATLSAFMFYHRRYHRGRKAPLWFCNLAFALSAPVAIWSIGGLEATLYMALIAWALYWSAHLLEVPDMKYAVKVGLLLGFVCLTRPEGSFFTMAIAAGLLACVTYPRKILIKPLIVLCAIPFAFFSAQVAFRLSYYGYWMPNSYYAKVTFGTYARLLNGGLYTTKALSSFLPLLLVLLLNLDKLARQPHYKRQRHFVIFFSLVSVAWLTVLIATGGDIFAGYRHILPVVPPMMFMLMDIAAISYDSGEDRKTHIFLFYLLACFFWLQCNFEENIIAKQENWEWQVKELGTWLGTQYHDTEPLVAASNTGAIPFYSKLPTLDMYGINDGYLTHHRSKIFGQGFMGHELFDSDYVMLRQPDIIIFFTGLKRGVYGSDLASRPDFLKQYKPVEIVLPSYTPTIWVKKDSKKVRIIKN